jgi:hypothetical protein
MTGGELTDDPRPTRTSTMFVVLAGLATAAALVRAADVVWPAVVGAVGALTLAVVIWACGWERHETAGSVLASLLVLPVGFGMVATTAGTILVLASSLFPAPSLSDVPTLVIHLSARAMVVTGGVATVFGVAAATRGILDEDAVEDAATTALLTATAPFLVALVLAVGAVLRYLEANAHGPGVKTLLGDVVREFSALIFQPEPLGPHIPTFTVLVGIALLATNRGLRALPLTELVPANGDGGRRVRVRR